MPCYYVMPPCLTLIREAGIVRVHSSSAGVACLTRHSELGTRHLQPGAALWRTATGSGRRGARRSR